MPYLLLKKLNRIDENENKNLKPIAIVKSEKKDKDPLHNAFLYLDMDDKPNSKKKTKIELDFHQKFEILPNTNSDKRNIFFIAGASGSGKSYITKQIVNNYAKLYPKRKIFIVSRLDEDETLDGIKSKNIIKLDIPSLVETPFDVNNPLFYKSCFVLDDVDDLPDKHQQKAVQDMLNAIAIMGRLHKKKKDEEGKETGQELVLDVKQHSEEFKKRLEQEMLHKMEVEDAKLENTYQSCCMTSDKRALEFFLKSGVIFSVLVFSMLQVITINDSSERNAFLNIVILILGTFLPSPKIKDNK
eukprot:jgi/Bigna1/140710/aug1.57_g15418